MVLFAENDGESEIVAENSAFVHPPQDGSAPPKVDSEVEVLHEKVTKQIIKEGHGQKPSKYSTCFCKYLCFFFVSVCCKLLFLCCLSLCLPVPKTRNLGIIVCVL